MLSLHTKTWDWPLFPFITVVDVFFFCQRNENCSVEAYSFFFTPVTFLDDRWAGLTCILLLFLLGIMFQLNAPLAYAGATEHCCSCIRLSILLASFCRVSMFGVFDICDRFFYINPSTFRDWFPRTVRRPRVQGVGLPHSAAIAQITLSSVKLCISIIYVDCFRVLRNETLVQWFNLYCASSSVCIAFRQIVAFLSFGVI